MDLKFEVTLVAPNTEANPAGLSSGSILVDLQHEVTQAALSCAASLVDLQPEVIHACEVNLAKSAGEPYLVDRKDEADLGAVKELDGLGKENSSRLETIAMHLKDP